MPSDFLLEVFVMDLFVHALLAFAAALVAAFKYRSPGAWGFFTFVGGLMFGLYGSAGMAVLSLLTSDCAPEEVREREAAAVYSS